MSSRHVPRRTVAAEFQPKRRRPFSRAGVALALAALTLAAAAQDGHHGPDGGRGAGGRPGGAERGPGSSERGGHLEGAQQQRPAGAAPHAGPGGPGAAAFGAPHMRFDNRFHDGHAPDGHYYPARGFVSASLPPGALNIGYRGGRYYYQGGVWFRPYGSRFTVIAPPFGIVLPVLPLAYATLWIGGAPYYYANDVYYVPAPGGYRVVAPPPGADAAPAELNDGTPRPPPSPPQAAAISAPPEPIFYPRNGQTPEQTEADRQQCNSWATTQPGAVADASVFQRALAACMDGRGYTGR